MGGCNVWIPPRNTHSCSSCTFLVHPYPLPVPPRRPASLRFPLPFSVSLSPLASPPPLPSLSLLPVAAPTRRPRQTHGSRVSPRHRIWLPHRSTAHSMPMAAARRSSGGQRARSCGTITTTRWVRTTIPLLLRDQPTNLTDPPTHQTSSVFSVPSWPPAGAGIVAPAGHAWRAAAVVVYQRLAE